MDEEQLEPLVGSGKKITLNNFFESIKSIDKVANNATKLTGQNSILIKQQTEIIESLKKTIEGLKKEVTQINAYITAQREEDKKQRAEQLRLETEAEDQKQKDEMEQRALSLKGMEETEGNSRNAPKPESKDKKDAKKEEPPGAGFLGMGAGLGIIGGVATQAFGGLTKLLGFAEGGKVNDTDNDKTNNNEDSVPAMLTPGEFVVTKDAVKKIGVDTLKGINAAAGATNKPDEIKIFEEGKKGSDFYEKTTEDFSGGGFDITTETTTREETDDSTLTTTEVLRERALSVGVPDLIEHKTQLLGEIHKLDGFEKVTIDDVINGTTGISDDKLFEIVNQSDAAKATEKKQEDAIKEDYKARNIKPGKGFSMSHDDEVAKSLAGTMGYRIGQINPDQKVFGFDEFTSRTREVFKSEKDPKFKEAHANAKKSRGVKGYSEGGLVKKDNGLSILNQLKTLTDPTKSSFAKKLKETADKDALGLENFAKSFSEEIGGKEGVKNIAGGVTKQVFSQFNDSISDEGGGGLVKDLINELMPQLLPEDVADMISASQDPMPLNANSPINVPQTPPNNQNVETQIPDAPFTAINLLKKMSRDNLNITVTTSNDLMSEIPEILKLIK